MPQRLEELEDSLCAARVPARAAEVTHWSMRTDLSTLMPWWGMSSGPPSLTRLLLSSRRYMLEWIERDAGRRPRAPARARRSEDWTNMVSGGEAFRWSFGRGLEGCGWGAGTHN